MSILNQLSSALNRRDEEANEHLAIQLCSESTTRDIREDIQELVDGLQHHNKGIRSDCIKVLYEIGAIKPKLITSYVDEFIALLNHKDNRLVWGGMTALGSIATLKADEIWQHIESIIETTKDGSVITQDWGIRVLSAVSAHSEHYAARIFPFLLDFLSDCRPKDAPRHTESMVIAATNDAQKAQLIKRLEAHKAQLKTSQLKRVEKLINQIS